MEPPPPPPPSSSLSQCAPLVPVPVPVTSTRAVVTAAEEDDGADGSGSASAATSTSRPVSAPSPPPSASSRHGVTATGVLATTTTALVHNRLTHAAGGMLSSTLTGLFTLLLVLFVYRKSFLLSFSGSSSSRNLSLTEYNTEYNRHVGASGTASGKARAQPPGSSAAGPDGAARRSPRAPPPPSRYPGGPMGSKSTLRIKLDQDQVVDEEGEVYRCIIKSALPEGSLRPCLRRLATLSPATEEGEPRPLLLEPSLSIVPSSPTLSNDGHESSTSSTSSSTSKKMVRLIEPSLSALELERLRSHWASCATSPACKGIGGYRSTRDIYAKGQGGDRTSLPSPISYSTGYTHFHPVPSPLEFGVDEQNNSLGLDVTPLTLPSSSGSTTLRGSGSRTRRLSPSASGRFAKDSLRFTTARSVSPNSSRLGGNEPAYLRNSSPAGSHGMSHTTTLTLGGGGVGGVGSRSERPGRPRWLRKKMSSSSLVDSPFSTSSTGQTDLSNSTTTPSASASGARPIQTIVLDGSEDSEGYEDCSEGSGTTTPVYGAGGGGGWSPLAGKGLLLGNGLRMSELIGKVGDLPEKREREEEESASLPLVSVEAPTTMSSSLRHVQA